MSDPTTKAELVTRMRRGHQDFYNLLARIPDERMTDIALYDAWTIKDFIAHIGAWQQSAADRAATLRRNEALPRMPEVDTFNGRTLERYRHKSLEDIRAMEAAGYEALEAQVRDASEEELFAFDHFPKRSDPLLTLIADNSYAHYAEHLDDVRAWMRVNGLD